MKINTFFLAILLILGGTLFTSCEKEDDLSSNKEILGFVFEASKNAEIDHNVIGIISGSEVIAEIPFGVNSHNLVPSIEVSPKATFGPAGGISTDFSNPVSYTITAEDGSTKVFTVSVPISPAPYIGSWETETSVNIESLGLSRIAIQISEDGGITMELKSTITGQLYGQSIKGAFEPLSRCNTEICLEQSHRWLDDQWTAEEDQHCIMYDCSEDQMEFKYCLCFPKDQWWFTVQLRKIE